MTKNEKRVLRELLKQVVRHDRWAWNQLKRQIWDLGYQSHYEAQGDFLNDIERRIRKLPDDTKHQLIEEWNTARPADKISTTNVVSAYTLLTLKEVIKRAGIAAYRTNWDSEY